MKQKTRIASKLFAALVVLTLISCCFLGTTFARYTSTNSGVANVSVAKWDINVGENNQFAVNWDSKTLSPSASGYNTEDPGPVSNETAVVAVAEIENAGDVDALVTVNQVAFSVTTSDGEQTDYDTKLSGDGEIDVYLADVEGLFKLYLYTDADGTTALTSDNLTVDAKGTKTIYGKVVWTTNYQAGDEYSGASNDQLDTWVGENVTTVNWSLSLTAVQASELPKPSTP